MTRTFKPTPPTIAPKACTGITFRDDEHVPYNRRPYERKAVVDLAVTDYDGSLANPDCWTEILVTETIFDDRGGSRSKTISVVLRGAERAALREALA